jgi:hypothetical protein
MERVSIVESLVLALNSLETVVLYDFDIFQEYIDMSHIIEIAMIYEFTKGILCSFSNILDEPTIGF